eukprot:2618909-Pyramimonas_sp.AAC.1
MSRFCVLRSRVVRSSWDAQLVVVMVEGPAKRVRFQRRRGPGGWASANVEPFGLPGPWTPWWPLRGFGRERTSSPPFVSSPSGPRAAASARQTSTTRAARQTAGAQQTTPARQTSTADQHGRPAHQVGAGQTSEADHGSIDDVRLI